MSKDRDGRIAAAGRQDWPPGEDTGWQDYHGQMFDLASAPDTITRWKIQSSGMNIARAFMDARNRGLDGRDPAGCPTPHPSAVLWLPYAGFAACLRCHRAAGDHSQP